MNDDELLHVVGGSEWHQTSLLIDGFNRTQLKNRDVLQYKTRLLIVRLRFPYCIWFWCPFFWRCLLVVKVETHTTHDQSANIGV